MLKKEDADSQEASPSKLSTTSPDRTDTKADSKADNKAAATAEEDPTSPEQTSAANKRQQQQQKAKKKRRLRALSDHKRSSVEHNGEGGGGSGGVSQFLDEEAEASSDVSSDEDELEDHVNKEDLKFVVNDNEEPVEAPKPKRRLMKKKKKKDHRLTEEDINLVYENTGTLIRPSIDDGDDGDDDDEDEDVEKPLSRLKKSKIAPIIEEDEPELARFADDQASDERSELEEEPMVEERDIISADDYGADTYEVEELLGDISTVLREHTGEGPIPRYDQFGVPSESERERERERELERGTVPLKSVMEPEELKQQFITPEDDEVRSTDVPERLQLRVKRRHPTVVGKAAIEEEASWIFKHGFGQNNSYSSTIIPVIQEVLNLIRIDNLEVPFIAVYRKEHYISQRGPSLSEADLWTIDHWDEKWDMMSYPRAAVMKLAEMLPEKDDLLIERIKNSASSSELGDLHDFTKWQLFRSRISTDANNDNKNEGNDSAQGGTRRRLNKRVLSFVDEATLKLVDRFGLSPRQFGENLQAGNAINVPQDPDSLDLEAEAIGCISSRFSTPEEVLAHARKIAARQLALDPLVRQFFRTYFLDHAVLSTHPTSKGRGELNWTHEFYPVKHFEKLPVTKSTDTIRFVMITQAEKEGFIEVKIEIEGSRPKQKVTSNQDNLDMDPVVSHFLRFYESATTSGTAARLNQQRRLIIQQLLVDFLYPYGERTVREYLLDKSQDAVTDEAKKVFSEMIRTGPLPEDKRRVLAGVMGASDEPSFFSLVNEYGEVIDHLVLHNFKLRVSANNIDQNNRDLYQRKKADTDKLREFVITHKPTYIAVAADSLTAQIFEGHIKHALYDKSDIPVALADPEVARIFMSSERGRQEFRDYAPLLRQAVGLARYLLSPLTEICSLWFSTDGGDQMTPNNELLALRLHPLQKYVPVDKLLRALRVELVKLVSQVGVDINVLIGRPHLCAPLSFVPGLGPRKAKAMLEAVGKDGFLTRRSDLPKEPLKAMGPTVYQNCAGFIKVRSLLKTPNENMTVLDATRIHPDNFSQAKQVVCDALDNDSNIDDKKLEELIEELRKKERNEKGDIELLELLDLEKFAEMEEKSSNTKLLEILRQIRTELNHPFNIQGQFREFQELSAERLFYLMSGETPESLRPGQHIQVQIDSFSQQGVYCRLDSGIKGFIHHTHLSSNAAEELKSMDGESREEWFREHLKLGTAITCCVREIKYERMTVELGSSSPDLQDKSLQERSDIIDSEYFVVDNPDEQRNKKQTKKPRFIPRSIVHPLFQNISSDEAITYLADRPQGDLVFRPSSRGSDYLMVTWKAHDDTFLHVEVHELRKPNPGALGRVLMIGKEAFEDLDEICVRFIEPMANYAKTLTEFRNFRSGDEEAIEQMLRDEKAATPNRIPYFISFSTHKPGLLRLTYLPNTTIKYDYIILSPKGFTFRSTIFSDLNDLINFFKSSTQSALAGPRSFQRPQQPHYQRAAPRPLVAAPLTSSGNPQPHWKVGDRCLAIWRDENMYEAEILQIDPQTNTALVRYAAYGNTGTVPLALLKKL